MAITVDPDSLAADGAVLADRKAAESPLGCEPASVHSVSVAVAARFSAHSASLAASIDHGHQVRAEGGLATMHTAASLRAADEAGAAVIAGKSSTSASASAPVASTGVPAPVPSEIPPMPGLAAIPGEAHAIALHTGPGPASLRELAGHWHSRATLLDKIAAETAQTSASIDAHWSDGTQRAGANTAAHGAWWSDMAGHARTLASAANDAADHHDRAVAETPTPQEFTDAHNQLAAAQAANVASHGMRSGQVGAAAARLAQMQSQATEAAAAYHAASTATTASIAGTTAPAPAIATAGAAASYAHSDDDGAGKKGSGRAKGSGGLGSPRPAESTSDPAVAEGNTNTGLPLGVGGGSLGPMAQSMLPAAAMLPSMAMAPMSALSGLAGLSQQPTAPTMTAAFAGQPNDDSDPALPADLGDTSPAASGAGGAEAVAGGPLAPPVSGPASSPPAVAGLASSVGTTAEGAATVPAGAAGGGAMSTYPPMMGAPGAGDGGAARDMRLYPDRRMVWRPLPNTEAVFGELPRERRSRAKRAAAEEGTNEG
ncbi:PPE domain-containing protein [Mycobacterium sp. SP-6446]|uniref:PPE domain-containing protein n=1 Tax=Mycobacterium sp. SP-6446 TaxID=1834162 RepID=UPI00096E553E|nr:PPE domain-containing protein [Mycobacterium sp. SP-6446]OMC13504.1 hypothetical protein A5736_22895 [Mycobacterium sp. SP-6446]